VQAPSAPPHVLVVLVAHDGAAWLPRTLAALDAQTHPDLDVVAVDNGSTDDSRRVLIEHLGPDRVLVAELDLGFGAAVSMALDARSAAGAPYVLLVHDDLVLDPDAVAHLVAALEADPRLAVVGPKLLSWHDDRELQSVGWTVDITGRADSGVDEGELDQGQRDQERRTLYVSTAGMLVRRATLDQLGRFDRRYHLFRDDLDLCWRAWLAGHDVEVVPDARGHHVAAATNYLRLGQTRFIGPRYFAERNTLATLLKNYGFARLLPTVVLYFLVGIAKTLGFLLTRRVSDAWQTVRAWLWNGFHLRETWRLRREVQRTRVRSDGELRELFGKLVPRVRAYAEAIAEWIAGGDVGGPSFTDRVAARAGAPPESATRRTLRALGRRPVLLTGAVLAVVFLLGAVPLLAPGELRGGDLAAWPASPAAFLTDYAAGWHEAGAFGTAASPSPAQAALGLVHLAAAGSSYLAPRLLLFGLPFVAWLFALRAAQIFSARRLPRVVAATAYVLSPPVLAAVTTGQLSALVIAAVLPGLVAAGAALSRPTSSAATAWRAVAGATLLTAVAASFEPLVLPSVLLGAAALLGVAVARVDDSAWRRALTTRIAVVTVGSIVLLLPWSYDLLTSPGPWRPGNGEVVANELWRWLALVPDLSGIPALWTGVGFLLAGLLGLALGGPRRPWVVTALWTVALAGALGGWWLGRTAGATWPGVPMLLTAAAFAGLLAVAFATAEAQLTRHAFGWRQLAALTTGLAVAVSLGTVATTLVRGPWDAYVVDEPALPEFIVNAAAEGDPFRVLVLADRDGRVHWEVVEGEGPTMAGFGLPTEAAGTDLVGPIVDDALSGRDPAAAAKLGALNVSYVFVPPGGESAALDDLLRGQPALEPRPVAEGRVLAVTGWLPRFAVVPDDVAAALTDRGEAPPEATAKALAAVEADRYRGSSPTPGTLVIAERPDPGWEAAANSQRLPAVAAPTPQFGEVPAGATVTLVHTGGVARGFAVTGQLLALLLAVSLALRPPGFARRGGPPRDVPADPRAPQRAPEVVA
jgi:GT2 family glycosyltransferase